MYPFLTIIRFNYLVCCFHYASIQQQTDDFAEAETGNSVFHFT